MRTTARGARNAHRSGLARFLFLWLALLASPVLPAQPSLGMDKPLISDSAGGNGLALAASGKAAPLLLDPADHWGVLRAASDLRADIEKVSGTRPDLPAGGAVKGAKTAILIGTIGKSALIDGLIKSNKLDVAAIRGKWESFVIATVEQPMPGVERALVVAGSDKRGTIYGVYEISEQIGVSPWHWWADVPARRRPALFAAPGVRVQGPPAVKYRGIFINDEEPALAGWSRAKFGSLNAKMYTHMFELLLRLRANYLWPAMWSSAFNEDDPENPRLADAYGIVMGTSHHEPMIRAHKEWTAHRKQYGNGEWNYLTNEAGVRRFFADGVRRNRAYESIMTMGMRGDGDVAMPDAGGMDANKK